MTGWQSVWSRKATSHETEDFSLRALMELDGYDISCSAVSVDDFIVFADALIEKLELTAGDAMLEVGCGAGALCKAVHDRGIRVAGIDYTPRLVEICQKAIPEGDFHASEGARLDLPKKDYDAVISHSVFHYFPSEDYAVETFRRMVKHVRPGGIVALTDMHDANRREEHEKRRKEMIGEKKYNELYKELSHTYYDPDVFAREARDLCSDYWLEDQFLKSESGKFKFNFFARK